MRKIASFGEWVREFWWLWIPVFVGIATALYIRTQPPTVTLDAKHWECTMAVPDGISTRCTEYNYKAK